MSDDAARNAGSDDDLLDDFNEVMNDLDDEGGKADGGDDLDELEAFLDDFDDDAASRSGAAAKTDPAVADDFDQLSGFEGLSTDAGDLNEDDLDLSDGTADELRGQADLDLDREPEPDTFSASPATPAAAQPAPAAAHANENTGPAAPSEAGSGKGSSAALAFGVVGMVLAMAAAGYAWVVSMGLTEMEQRLAGVEAVAGRPAGNAALGDVLRAQQQLRDRVDELAVILDGPLGHLQESSRRELEGLAARVNELESAIKGVDESVAELDGRLAKLGQAPVKAASAAPATPSASSESAPKASAPVSGNWVVNLASLTDRKAAESEVARLAKAGIKAEVNVAKSEGRTWYRVRVPGFKDSTSARQYARNDAAKAGYKNAWIATR